MKKVLILGAGQSAPYLIRYLLDRAGELDWRVTVADRDAELAARRVGGHPRGEPTGFDADDQGRRSALIAAADLVVNLLPPALQPPVARDCVRLGRHMVSASYTAPEVRALSDEAERRGVLLLTEIGLDPGIDHMSTMALIDRLRGEGAEVESFQSYGSGVPAPDSIANPLGYAITWNPRNVVMAGAKGARYLRRGRVRIVPPARVFAQTWPVAVDGVGTMDAYANRDSLPYRETFGLAAAETVVRATLRHPGFCAAWKEIVRLGLPDEEAAVSRLGDAELGRGGRHVPPRRGGGGDRRGAGRALPRPRSRRSRRSPRSAGSACSPTSRWTPPRPPPPRPSSPWSRRSWSCRRAAATW